MPISLRMMVCGLMILMASTICAQDSQCPSYHSGKPFIAGYVLDGPPRSDGYNAYLEPDANPHNTPYVSVSVGYIYDAGRRAYLLCQYGSAAKKEVVTVNVQKRVARCIARSTRVGKPGSIVCK
jgi:hypothetical protein